MTVTSFWSAHQRGAAVTRERAAWGTTVIAWCAARTISPGESIADSVNRCEIPISIAPTSAISTTEGIAAQRIDGGSVITGADIAPGDGPLALAPDGWVAVMIVESVPSDATTGERVMLTSDGVVLAEDAVILEDDGAGSGDGGRLVAVPRRIGAVVAAVADRGISILRAVPAPGS